MRQLSVLYTGNQQCYSVRYSPFDSSLIACVSCDKFGLSGAASLSILQYQESDFFASKFAIIESFKLNVSLFDVEWSPIDPSLLLTANGDGSVGVWRYQADQVIKTAEQRAPIFRQKQHDREVYSVQWEPSGMRSYHFLSVSWDQTIKIWNLNSTGLTSLTSLNGHESLVYAGAWNPNMSGILLSCSADKTFRIWDVNASSMIPTPIFTSPLCKSDVLCCDWSRFESNNFVVGYASGLIEVYDFRKLQAPLMTKAFDMAHDYAIRKVRFSPHNPNIIGSVSYDMTTKVFHTTQGLKEASKNHSEFAYGFDFDPKLPNRLVDCGWDRRVIISEFAA